MNTTTKQRAQWSPTYAVWGCFSWATHKWFAEGSITTKDAEALAKTAAEKALLR